MYQNTDDWAYIRTSWASLPSGTYRYSIQILEINTTAAMKVGLSAGEGPNNIITTSGTYTGIFVHDGGYIDFQIRPSSTGIGTVKFDNVSVKEILPESTTYTFSDKTVNNILTHTTNWSESDRIKIENNPYLIGKLALSHTNSIPELDMILDQGV